MWIDVPLLLNDLRKQPPFDGEEPFLLQPGTVLAGDKERKTHPEGNSDDYLEKDTSEAPHVDCPGLSIVVHDFFVEVFLILTSVLVNDIVKNLGRHILRSGH